MPTIEERKTALLAKTSTGNLIDAALKLEKKKAKTPDERMTAAWISDELEKRAGLITDAEGQDFIQMYDLTDSYLAALLYMRPLLINEYSGSMAEITALLMPALGFNPFEIPAK